MMLRQQSFEQVAPCWNPTNNASKMILKYQSNYSCIIMYQCFDCHLLGSVVSQGISQTNKHKVFCCRQHLRRILILYLVKDSKMLRAGIKHVV